MRVEPITRDACRATMEPGPSAVQVAARQGARKRLGLLARLAVKAGLVAEPQLRRVPTHRLPHSTRPMDAVCLDKYRSTTAAERMADRWHAYDTVSHSGTYAVRRVNRTFAVNSAATVKPLYHR